MEYQVFDLVYLDGVTIIKEPLSERRRLLERIVGDGKKGKLEIESQKTDAKTTEQVQTNLLLICAL